MAASAPSRSRAPDVAGSDRLSTGRAGERGVNGEDPSVATRRPPFSEQETGGGGLRFAGLSLDRPRLMGIINVTPDSFSDGGEAATAAAAISRGEAMLAAGADILDVGGESTRPGAAPVSVEVEVARVVPVVSALAARGAVVSIDTRHAPVMAAAISAGARIVNDITALTGDRAALPLVAGSGVSVVLMHMQGEPRTMQDDPRYDDVVADIYRWLAARVAVCRAAGMPSERIAVDPGIGFGKTPQHNVRLLANVSEYATLGCSVLVGVSRKRFIARLSRDEEPKARLAGSIAAGLAALMQGGSILRVHDVAETSQAIAVWQAIFAERSATQARSRAGDEPPRSTADEDSCPL